MDEVIFTDQNFREEILKSDIPVLVDFGAQWCGPCQMIAPIIEELAKEYQGKVKIGKVDVDSNPMISRQYGIMNIPTLIIFKRGKIIEQMVGLISKEEIKKKLDEAISKS